jgi:F420-dependent oxidoreductase-like protein
MREARGGSEGAAMRLGVMVEGQEGLGWEIWRRLFRAVEDLGFESLWRSDHFFSFGEDRTRDSLEPFVSMTLLAAETERIRFGPLVTAVTFRHPAMVARMAAQIDRLSGGRMVLGMGAGWNVPEHAAFGVRMPPAGERLDRLAEAIQVVQALWGEGPASFAGRHFTLEDAECYPKPAQQPLPVLVGGNGERRALRIVAEHANEWNGIYLDVDGYRAKAEVLARHCEAVGRDPATIAHSMMLGFVVGNDERELGERYARIAGNNRRLAGPERDLESGLAALRRRGWLVGAPSEVVETLGRLDEAGLSRVMLHHLAMDDFDALEVLARDVLPQVRAAG